MGLTRTRARGRVATAVAAATIEPNEWPGQHRLTADYGQQLARPRRVARDVVRVVGKARGLAEAGQVRHHDPQLREVGDDRLQPVVVAAQAVQEHDRPRRVGRAVGPARGDPAAQRDLVAAHRQALDECGVRGAVEHRRSL